MLPYTGPVDPPYPFSQWLMLPNRIDSEKSSTMAMSRGRWTAVPTAAVVVPLW